MTLNKRYKRNIKSNRSFYISSIILTIIALSIFLLFNIAGNGIINFADDFFDRHNLSDASFTTYLPIAEEDIASIEEKYDLELDCGYYINFHEDDYTARVFKKNSKINTYEITKGRDVASDNEMIISEGYAVNMHVAIGDSLSINGQNYTVCGYFQRPDYLYMLEEPDDTYKNITSFFLAYVSNNTFCSYKEASCEYLVKYHSNNQKDFRIYINDTYQTRTYLSSEDNPRIYQVKGQAKMFVIMSWIMLVMVPLITVALISIIIGRKVKNEQKLLGTLSALGYRKSALIRHYVTLAMIPGLIGGIITVIFVRLIIQPYGSMGLADYEPLHITFILSPVAAICAIVIPTALYILSAYHTVKKLLKKNTVILLNGNAEGEKKTKKILVNSKCRTKTKFALRSLINNFGRTFVVFLGIFIGTFIVLLGYTFIDCIKGVSDIGIKETGNFEYEYFLNQLNDTPLTLSSDTDTDAAYEYLIAASFERSDNRFQVIGVPCDSELFNLKTENGKADIDNGFYITSLCAEIYDLEKGDTFTFHSETTLQEYSVPIAGIIENTVQKGLISSKKNVNMLLGFQSDTYNVIISDKKLNIDNGVVASTMTRSAIKEQMSTILDEMDIIINSLIIMGAVICIAAIYVCVNMVVTENQHNISMLKVLGYKNKEINRMVLNVNHMILPIGLIIGVPTVYLTCKLIFKIYAGEYGILIPTVINPVSIILTILVVCLCYFGSLALIRRKISKVDMIESLKDNRN